MLESLFIDFKYGNILLIHIIKEFTNLIVFDKTKKR